MGILKIANSIVDGYEGISKNIWFRVIRIPVGLFLFPVLLTQGYVTARDEWGWRVPGQMPNALDAIMKAILRVPDAVYYPILTGTILFLVLAMVSHYQRGRRSVAHSPSPTHLSTFFNQTDALCASYGLPFEGVFMDQVNIGVRNSGDLPARTAVKVVKIDPSPGPVTPGSPLTIDPRCNLPQESDGSVEIPGRSVAWFVVVRSLTGEPIREPTFKVALLGGEIRGQTLDGELRVLVHVDGIPDKAEARMELVAGLKERGGRMALNAVCFLGKAPERGVKTIHLHHPDNPYIE
jgi:hypothetical protein